MSELTEIIEVEGQKVPCSRWWLFAEQLSLLVPDGMQGVTPRELGSLFVEPLPRPQVVLRNPEALNFLFYYFEAPLANDQVAGTLTTYKREQTQASHLTEGMLNGCNGLPVAYYDFVNYAPPQPVYSFHGLMSLGGKLLNFQWVGPQLERQLFYRGLFRRLTKTITIEKR